MLIVGLVETGPDIYQLQLLAETGEIVEYTVSKNDKNFWSLSLIENRSQYPRWGTARSLRSLRFAVLCCAMLRKPAGRGSERVARADHLLQIILNKRSHLSAG